MDDCTPTTEEIREGYARNATGDHTLEGYYTRRAAFDRWIAEHDQAVAGKALNDKHNHASCPR